MGTQDNVSIVKELYESFNSRDFKKAANFADSNTEILNVAANMTFKGPDGLIQYLEEWKKAFPDSKTTVNNIFGTGDYVVCEFTGTGTHTGTFSTPEGDIMPTNKKLAFPICEVFKFRNGKILSVHTYFDSHTVLKQLGVLPELKHH